MYHSQRAYHEKQKAVRDAIKQMKEQDPEKFKELQRLATDMRYAESQRKVREEEERRRIEEERRRIEEERLRLLRVPVLGQLPAIDFSGIKGKVAFRVWRLGREYGSAHYKLQSVAVSRSEWKMSNFADRIPDRDNSNGFYAIKLSGMGVLSTANTYFDAKGSSGVSGFVELLGKVIEHTDGVFRAEVLRLICLFVSSECDKVCDVVRSLCEQYPLTPIYVLTPEQIADCIMREVWRQYIMGEVSLEF